MAMRVAGDKEGKGGKAMVMATRVAGKWAATAMGRAMMATATREAGREEGNSKCNKYDVDGKEDGKGKQQRQQP